MIVEPRHKSSVLIVKGIPRFHEVVREATQQSDFVLEFERFRVVFVRVAAVNKAALTQ